MSKVLIGLHVALACVLFMPVYDGICPEYHIGRAECCRPHPPGQAAAHLLRGQGAHPSVAAAALPSLGALLNLPLLLLLRESRPRRWTAASSAAIGVLALLGWGTLMDRYGWGGLWGIRVGVLVALALALAGTGAWSWDLGRRHNPDAVPQE